MSNVGHAYSIKWYRGWLQQTVSDQFSQQSLVSVELWDNNNKLKKKKKKALFAAFLS